MTALLTSGDQIAFCANIGHYTEGCCIGNTVINQLQAGRYGVKGQCDRLLLEVDAVLIGQPATIGNN